MIIFLIVLVVLGFAGTMAKLSMDHEREKRQDKLRAQDNSLGVSELEAMIRDAVREATADLEARLEALEQGEEADVRPSAKLPLGRPAKEAEIGLEGEEDVPAPARRTRV